MNGLAGLTIMSVTPITPEELQSMLKQNPDLQVVDVRTQEEYQYLGHLPQAKLIPLHELPYAFRVLNSTEDVVVMCQHGVRSVDACYFLEAQGFDRLFNLQNGLEDWPGPLERDVSKFESLINPQQKETP